MVDVERHWGLAFNPFGEGAGRRPFVPTPTHAEAVARLLHAIESGDRRATIEAPAGLGKSTVLDRVLAEARGPSRRVARAVAPADGIALLAELAVGLGARVAPGSSRAAAWKALADAARLCRLQGLAVVLAVDEAGSLPDPSDLDRLVHVDPHPQARLTVILARRGRGEDSGPGAEEEPWGLAVRLAPLTRSEAGHYLAAKLAEAGRPDAAFTPRAEARLHALSGGVPRGIDRLASLALMAGALRGLEIIPPDVVEGVSAECTRPGDVPRRVGIGLGGS
jgi:type II secretory pathway predicted ATPase ExeA